VNLQQLRDYIRMQLDMDQEELPDPMLDAYLQEAFDRTVAMEQRWPSREVIVAAAKLAGAQTATLPAGMSGSGIMSVIDTTNGGTRLVQVSNEQAEDNFTHIQTTTIPMYYSLWGPGLRLWPSPDVEIQLQVRGYRDSLPWMAGGTSAEPDLDPRLHISLAHYAIALSYAQQEDDVLEDVYMKRFTAGFQIAHEAICNPRHHRPVIYAGGLPLGGTGAQSMIWGPPVAP
jgi:hypothetical protein